MSKYKGTPEQLAQFARDIEAGLTATPRRLPSKYFYDERGDELFQLIMKMPEYYLTDCEFEIFSMQRAEILRVFAEGGKKFRLIEFGAGDGTKTKLLLKHFVETGADFTYVPIDISGHVLEELTASLAADLPALRVQPMAYEYFEALNKLDTNATERNVVLFLGSNIGNFRGDQANNFLTQLNEHLNPGDRVMIGMDLKKDPATVLAAYNDASGITKAFNMNLLRRINEELKADFDLDKFQHWPVYDPYTGEAKSYLVSLKDQDVRIGYLDKTFHFKAFEAVHTELSQKYDLHMIADMAASSGFEVAHNFFDCKHWFVDSVWVK